MATHAPRTIAALTLAMLACATPASRAAPAHPSSHPATYATHAGERPGGGQAAHALATGTHGAVTSAEQTASDIGRDVLARGGNAIDAAVAVGFALGVSHPSAANIGGGGFMIIRFADGRSTAIDYREVAPRAATRDMFLDARGNIGARGHIGPLAAGVPGVVAGLALAHARYGTLPWASLLAPAVALARDGVVLDHYHASELAEALARVRAYADAIREGAASTKLDEALSATSATFGRADGAAYAMGDRFRQPLLAETLARIAEDGPAAFYRGALAARMADEVHAMGGIWTAEDLEAYRAIERAPIVFDYHGHEIVTMPPPSAGGIVLRQILAAADALALHEKAWESPERIHLYVEILRRAYADRNQLLGDPDFVQIPLARLLSLAYVTPRMRDIDARHATDSRAVRPGVAPAESPNTTHFSVVDGAGNAVANTYTLNTNFGALVQIPGTGVTLNNEMDDFTAKPGAPNLFGLVQGAQNAIAPGKRMLSSMSPTIVSKQGALRAVLGSPGGPTITTTVAQILMQLVDYGRPLERAVGETRIHHQWMPDHIMHEPTLTPETQAALRALGHALSTEPAIGHAHCIEVSPADGTLRAVADVARGGGGAAAY